MAPLDQAPTNGTIVKVTQWEKVQRGDSYWKEVRYAIGRVEAGGFCFAVEARSANGDRQALPWSTPASSIDAAEAGVRAIRATLEGRGQGVEAAPADKAPEQDRAETPRITFRGVKEGERNATVARRHELLAEYRKSREVAGSPQQMEPATQIQTREGRGR